MSKLQEKPEPQLEAPVHELISSRWSPRALNGKPIAPETLKQIFEGARWAPSCFNLQPWSFIYAHKGTPEFDKILSVLLEGNRIWAKEASVLAIGVAHLINNFDGKPNDYAWYDLGQAVHSLVMQATELGISSHQMAGFDRKAAQEAYSIPEGKEPAVALALGYRGDAGQLPEELKQAELAQPKRKPQDDFVFEGEYRSES